MSDMKDEFKVHRLNGNGMLKAQNLGEKFSETLELVERLGTNGGGREVALARTALQEASFWAKRAMALDPANRE